MSNSYSKLYEMPFSQFLAAQTLFNGESIDYRARFGLAHVTLQVLGSREEIAYAEELLQMLWVTRESTIFPKRHMTLVREELEAWGIEYKRSKNPFVFEIITEIDQRKLERFVKNIKSLTKKPKRQGKGSKGRENNELSFSVPDNASGLF